MTYSFSVDPGKLRVPNKLEISSLAKPCTSGNVILHNTYYYTWYNNFNNKFKSKKYQTSDP